MSQAAANSIAALQTQFPYQFQQWSIARERSSLHRRPGWHGLFARLCEDVHEVLTPPQRRSFSWLAVKQRFGAMRSYFAGELNPTVSQLVREAEAQSTRVCELCGGDGARRDFGGVSATRCPHHAVELAARALMVREQHLARAQEPQLRRCLAQWMHTTDPRWAGQSPQVLCATSQGTRILLELLMLQLEPSARH